MTIWYIPVFTRKKTAKILPLKHFAMDLYFYFVFLGWFLFVYEVNSLGHVGKLITEILSIKVDWIYLPKQQCGILKINLQMPIKFCFEVMHHQKFAQMFFWIIRCGRSCVTEFIKASFISLNPIWYALLWYTFFVNYRWFNTAL